MLQGRMLSLYRKMHRVLTPQLKPSQYRYKDKLDHYLQQGTRWLDAGCGHGVFPRWMKERGDSLVARSSVTVGVDCYCPNLQQNRVVHHRVAGNLEELPFSNASFDVATANMVVEHLANPERVGRSVNRVLSPGGLFIFHTPNYWHYQTVLAGLFPQRVKETLIRLIEGRKEADVFPTHYRLNTPAMVQRLAVRTGFAVRDLDFVNSLPETLNFGPLWVIELLVIWILEFRPFRLLRSNLVVVLEKVQEV